MFIQRIPRSKRVMLKGVTVRLLVGLMVFYLFTSLITSPALADGPDGSAGPDGSWTECATEGANCSFSGMKEVRLWGTGAPEPNYGIVSKTFTDGTACTVAAFGNIDPANGAYKKCYYRDVRLDSAVTAIASELDKKVTVTFNVYAIQAGTLDELKSRITVKRTGETAYTALSTEDTIANPTSTAASSTLEINFKDKLVGSENSIQIDYGAFRDSNGWQIDRLVTSLIVGDTPDGSFGWTNCAEENGYCSFSGTKEVRFWAAGQPSKFKSIISTNGTGCTMAAFGNDPAFGTVKRCYYRDVQFDSGVTAVVSGLNKKVTFTFHTYAIQAGTLDELKSKITVKKTGAYAYTALGAEDIVANPTSTATSSTLEINFKDPLVGSENSIQIAPEAFKDSNGRLIVIVVTSLVVGDTPEASYGWTNCAANGELCGFYGRKEVRYWGIGTPVPNYGYISKIITAGGAHECTLFAFGTTDPAPGSTKRCYYRDVQLDTEMKTAVSGLNKKVTVTFHTYAIPAGNLDELKSKITVKKTGTSAYTALGAEDTVENPTSTTTSSTLEIKLKDTLVGSGNSIKIAPGAFKDSNGQTIYIPVSSSLTVLGLGPDGSIGWTDCAAEGGNCSFSGRKEVRYWGIGAPAVPANYGFISKVFTGGTRCPFGDVDPAFGTYKRCYYRDVQLDSGVMAVVSGTNNRVTIAFNTYAMQAGTLEELKSKITVKKTGGTSYIALGAEDMVVNPTSTATSSTLEINFKYPLVGPGNSIQIASGAFKDSDGQPINISVSSSLALLGYGPDGSIGWTDCAAYGANCYPLGTKEVRLWGTGTPALPVNYGFTSKIIGSTSMTCTVATFNYIDPAPNTFKRCYYRDIQPYSLTKSDVSGLNNKVTFTFNTYAIKAGTLDELKSKIEVKKTGASAYIALGPEDTVENPTSGTLVINFKDSLVGSENSVVIGPGAFKGSDGQPINISIASPLTLLTTAPDGSFGWEDCAADGAYCKFSGTKEVRYWRIDAPAIPANSGFVSKVLTGGAACNGTFFGNDPAPGISKRCYYRDVQLDSAMTVVVGGPNNKVTFTFKSYATQAGTLDEWKSKITVKKTGASAYTALGPEDTVAANPRSSTFEINFKDALVGTGNSIRIAPGAFKDWNGQSIDTSVSFPLFLLPAPPDGSPGWTYCSAENENCIFSGRKEVRFWGTGTPAVPANYGFISNISITYTGCSADSFGKIDPAPGTIKRCFYRDVQLDNLLSNLTVDQGTWASSPFSPTILNYMVQVPNTVTTLNFDVTKVISSQTLTVTGAVYTTVAGAVYSTVTGNVYTYATSNLNAGFNQIKIKVTSQDGTFFTYNLSVYRAPLIATETPIPVSTAPVTITVPYGVNASIQAPVPTPVPDVPNTVQTTLPQVEVSASTVIGNVRVTIPSGTTVTAPAGWNGAINLPHQVTFRATTNGTIQAVIEMGSTTQSLTFSKAVRIVMPYQAGRNVGFVRSGETVVIPITTVLTADNQAAGDALPAGGDGKINVGSDLVIWTKHFTQFVTFTTGTTPDSGGGGGASSTNSDYIYVSTGGTLTLNGAKITVPAEVVAGNVNNFKVTVDKVTDTSSLPMNASSKRISDVFEIKKDIDGKFTKAVSITLPFDVKHVDLDQSVIGIYWLNEETQKWILLDNIQVDKVNGSVTGSVDHFTKFAVLATAKPIIPPISVVFSDISGHWSEANIKQAVSGGIVTGYPDGTFKPNAAVTRAEFAVMLMNAIKTQGGGGAELKFTDKAKIGAWAQKAVAQAMQAGIITGYEDDTFRPDAVITRAEMATMIAGASGKSIEANMATGFADDKDIPAWAKGAIALMKKLGYLEGKGNNTFDPNVGTTRGEAVTILLKMLALKSK